MRVGRWGFLLASVLAAPAYALDASAMAPLSKGEFYAFFDAYHEFSECIDGLARRSGLDADATGKALSESGKAQDLIAQAEAILAPESPFHAQIHSAQLNEQQRVQVALAALLDQASTTDSAINQTRHLVSLAMARLFVARASDGSCGPSKAFMTLFDKARNR